MGTSGSPIRISRVADRSHLGTGVAPGLGRAVLDADAEGEAGSAGLRWFLGLTLLYAQKARGGGSPGRGGNTVCGFGKCLGTSPESTGRGGACAPGVDAGGTWRGGRGNATLGLAAG